MAYTYTYTDVLSMSGKALPRDVEDSFSAIACNVATELIWYYYDWRESLVVLPPFNLIPNEQDHNFPAVIIPADFHGLRQARLCRYVQSAIAKINLEIIKDLSLTHIKTAPSSICYMPSNAAFRVHPRVPENLGSPTWFVEGTYKKRPLKITQTTLNTTLPFDDMYIHVFVEAMRWALMMLGGSPAAGQMQIVNSVVQYSGQLSNAMSSIEQMASAEGAEDGDSRIAPESALVPGALGTPYNFPSLFGVYG